jgi:predicted DCC family thiol-disulfide oxidoreductase YuxK
MKHSDTHAVVIFDGQCEFCRAQAERLAGGSPVIRLRSFHDEGVLDDYPDLTFEMCMESMKLIERDGTMYDGAEALLRALAIRRRALGKIPLTLYRVPGVRWIVDRAYAWIAKNRYRIMGRSETCETGRCRVHGRREINE